MNSKSIKLLIFIPLFFSFCLKAKKSPFDLSSPSSAGATGFFAAQVTPTTTTSSSSSPVATEPAPTPTPVATPAAIPDVAPSNISISGKSVFKLIPGNPVNYPASADGTVDRWSIAPTTLPTGLFFNTSTGAITGTPDPSYLTNGGFALTRFTVSAHNGTAKKDLPIDIEIVPTGGNVWTVLNGVTGRNTSGGVNTLKYDATCNCIYMSGHTSADLDGQTNPSIGNNQVAYVSRYDIDGNRVWTRLFGTAAAVGTTVLGLVIDSTGNIYLSLIASTGNFNGFNITAAFSGCIIKYDSSGNLLWTNCSDPASRHYYNGLVIDTNGDIVGAGAVYDASVNGLTHSSGTDQAGLLQKFNPMTGARITGVTIPGNSARGTDAMGISRDNAGNLFVAVGTRSSSYCGNGSVYFRPALFRFNSSMVYLNCTGIVTGSYHSFAFGSTTDSNGDVYLSGYFKSLGGTTFDGQNKIGDGDGFVTKFTASGTKLWTRLIGMAGASTAIKAVAVRGSSLYFAGSTTGSLPGAGIIQGGEDMFVAKYDLNGTQPAMDPNYWTTLQGIQNGVNAQNGCILGGDNHAAGCNNGITFDSDGAMYSFGDTVGTLPGVINNASPYRSFFLVRKVQ